MAPLCWESLTFFLFSGIEVDFFTTARKNLPINKKKTRLLIPISNDVFSTFLTLFP